MLTDSSVASVADGYSRPITLFPGEAKTILERYLSPEELTLPYVERYLSHTGGVTVASDPISSSKIIGLLNSKGFPVHYLMWEVEPSLSGSFSGDVL